MSFPAIRDRFEQIANPFPLDRDCYRSRRDEGSQVPGGYKAGRVLEPVTL